MLFLILKIITNYALSILKMGDSIKGWFIKLIKILLNV